MFNKTLLRTLLLHGRHFDPQDLNEFNNSRHIDFYLLRHLALQTC